MLQKRSRFRPVLRWLPCLAAVVVLGQALGSDEKPSETPALTNPKPRINVIRDDASAIRWKIDKQRVDGMVEAGLLQATGSENPTAGWLSLVSPEDTVGIKVNAGPGQISGTRREVADTVVRGLLKAGIPSKQIIIWDAKLEDLHKAKFDTLAKRHGVRLAGSMDAGWDESVVMDKAILGTLIEGDVGFDPDEEKDSRKSHFSRLITGEITRIISIQPLINHNRVGVSGHLVGLTRGAVDNDRRFSVSDSIFVTALPDIIAKTDDKETRYIGDRLALCITDALYMQYLGQSKSLLHYTEPLGQLWFSTDPVALDVLGIETLEAKRQDLEVEFHPPRSQLYENAAAVFIGESDPKRRVVEYFKRD